MKTTNIGVAIHLPCMFRKLESEMFTMDRVKPTMDPLYWMNTGVSSISIAVPALTVGIHYRDKCISWICCSIH